MHLTMWLCLALLAQFGLIKNYNLSWIDSSLFVAKLIIGNVLIFYIFFYFIYPGFILKKRFFLAVMLMAGVYFLYQVVIYFIILLILKYANIENPGLLEVTRNMVKYGFLHVFSIHVFLGNAFYIVSYLSPVFGLKIIADVTKSAYRSRELQKQKTELEVGFLKSQLNPHFLFNTLNSIYILNLKKDESASEVILELTDILRYTLYESNAENVVLVKELIFLENYINLERVRQNKRTRINYVCNFESAGTLTIAPLLTFPFIENAFKHGLGTSLKDAWLDINIKVEEGIFYFSSNNSKNEENNGPQLNDYFGGIGMANTKKRLALLYPGKYVLEIINTPDQYSINMKIDLNYE